MEKTDLCFVCVCVFLTSSWKIVFQQFSLLCYLFFVVIRNVDHLHGLYNPIAGMTDVRVLRQRAFLVLSHTDTNRGTSCLDRQAAWTEFRGRKIRLKNSRNQGETLGVCGSSGTGWIFFISLDFSCKTNPPKTMKAQMESHMVTIYSNPVLGCISPPQASVQHVTR